MIFGLITLEEVSVPDDHDLNRRRVSGPVAVLSTVVDFDGAIRAANSGRCGVVSSLHTSDLEKALSAVDRLNAAMVRVNAPTTGAEFLLPLEREKDPRKVREKERATMDFYTSTRTVSLLPTVSA